ncbi:CBO0543 family protein [Clostridium zeae]|uniref:CBO0543 family protein n=1 Tax=Clostridium zeae TaxID=2759022 RepID=UPI001A8F2556|nr:CBO0543 family protein [Clostridium zeae]
MRHILLRIIPVFVFLFSAYRWGDWKRWQRYYPTMLFFGFGDLIYITVFHDKVLWDFPTNFLVSSLDELLLIFGIFFPTTLLLLTYYPQKLYCQISYIIMWIAIYMFIEVVDLITGIIVYSNGWSIWWSLLHNTVQFPLIALHHRKPLLSWIIALIFLAIIMNIFNVPFTVIEYPIVNKMQNC